MQTLLPDTLQDAAMPHTNVCDPIRTNRIFFQKLLVSYFCRLIMIGEGCLATEKDTAIEDYHADGKNKIMDSLRKKGPCGYKQPVILMEGAYDGRGQKYRKRKHPGRG